MTGPPHTILWSFQGPWPSLFDGLPSEISDEITAYALSPGGWVSPRDNTIDYPPAAPHVTWNDSHALLVLSRVDKTWHHRILSVPKL